MHPGISEPHPRRKRNGNVAGTTRRHDSHYVTSWDRPWRQSTQNSAAHVGTNSKYWRMACPPFAVEVNSSYIQEIGPLSGVGITILCLRLAVRSRTIGVQHFEWDDWFIVPVLLLTAVTNAYGMKIYRSGAITVVEPEQLSEMVPCQIEMIKSGFKAFLIVWYTATALTWAFKSMMLLFLHRVMRNLGYEVWLRIIVVTTVVSYVAVLVAITFNCRPMSEFWRVLPPQGADACRNKRISFWAATIGNLLTDLMMICLPVPMTVKMRAPLLKRLLLACLLSTGILAAATVMVRLVFTLEDVPVDEMMLWGARELLAANCAVNLPFLKPLFTKRFWQTERQKCKSDWQGRRPKEPEEPVKRLGVLPSVPPTSWARSAESPGIGPDLRPDSVVQRRSHRAEWQHPAVELIERSDEHHSSDPVDRTEKQEQR